MNPIERIKDPAAWQRLVAEEAAGASVKHPAQKPVVMDPCLRVTNIDEVDQGFEAEAALRECGRCIQCKNRACQKGLAKNAEIVGGCPVGLRIPDFIEAFRRGDIRKAYAILMEDNPLHRITARVCPQDEQCQATCTLSKTSGPVAIGLLERIIGDLHAQLYGTETREEIPPLPLSRDFPVAIAGSGPAALTAAIFLARRGYRRIYMFEAFHLPSGVLRYGIPGFRLPRAIINEVVAYVQSLGVRIITDVVVGRTLTVSDLRHMGFRAVFLGTGAGLPIFMKIPGEELNGVISANEFLTRCNLLSAGEENFDTPVQVGRRVVVVGGGNVAMDAARWARRLGAGRYGAGDSEVIVVYRRTREDMPARSEEIVHAGEEGIRFVFLSNPVAFLEGAEKGWVGQVRCQVMAVGDDKDRDGRSRIRPVDGEFVVIDHVDTVIEALGTRPNALLADQNRSLEQDAGRVIVKDLSTGATSIDGVFAGGDAARGGATVILAMGDGKKAAAGIDAYLKGLSEDAGGITVDEKLARIDAWFVVKENRVLAAGQTKAGHPYHIFQMVVSAPLIAARAEAGQFVIVMPDKEGERIPLTLADWNKEAGTITLVVQEVGVSTYKLGSMKPGEHLFSVLGPLGHASVVEALGPDKVVICVGGGVGIAPVYPIARAHQAVGNRVVSIIGARSEKLMFWEQQMRAVSEELYKTLDDRGEFVTHALERLLEDDAQRQGISHIVAIGPVPMMENVARTVARVCQSKGVLSPRVIVSLNPTMMDGTGMCGGCRLLVSGSAKYCCVDGPEFDASLVDFEGLKRRQAMYLRQEGSALDSFRGKRNKS